MKANLIKTGTDNVEEAGIGIEWTLQTHWQH